MEAGYTVLVAEDEAAWQEILVEILEDEGCHVRVVDSYRAAWESLLASEVDLLVLDLDLVEHSPVFAGTRLLNRLRHADADVPCIIVSGKGTIPIVRQAFKEFAVCDFFEKDGFDIHDFQSSVRNALASMPHHRRLSYLDLEIEFYPRRGALYPVAVRSPLGARSASVAISALPAPLADDIPTEPAARELGMRLFGALFNADGPAGEFYQRLQERLDDSTALRIKVGADLMTCPDLASVVSMPWEYLYDDRRRYFLGLHARHTVVRYVPSINIRSRSPMRLPLNMLVVSATPCDLPLLDVEGEKRWIRKALHAAVKVDFVDHVTRERLCELLDSQRVHIVHYIGHGAWQGGKGVLYLEDARGLADPIDGEKLGNLVAGSRSSDIRLIVLNACQSATDHLHGTTAMLHSIAVQMVARGVPAVIAMQFPLSERLAIEFARRFYQVWPARGSVEEAMASARRQMYAQESEIASWGAPVLFVTS